MTVKVKVTTKVNQAAMKELLSGPISDGVSNAARKVESRAKAIITAAGRVRTGQMRDEVRAEPVVINGNRVGSEVIAHAPHSVYQHEGTANDGQGFIYPQRAQVLRFTARSGAVVFTPWVRGVKGVPFLTMALEELNESDFSA